MKKYAILPFLFMAFVTFAQPKIHSITSFTVGKEKQKTVQLFDYQDNGLTVKQQSWEYKRVDSTPQLSGIFIQRFTNDKRLISDENTYFYPNSFNLFFTSKSANKFDKNGCFISKSDSVFDSNNKVESVYTNTILTDAKCRVLQETLRKYERLMTEKLEYDSFETVKKFEYDSRDSLKTIRFNYFYKGLSSTNFQSGILDYKRRGDGKIIEIYGENICEFCTDIMDYKNRYFIDYNTDGQVIMEKTTALRDKVVTTDSVFYVYNLDKQLIQKNKFGFEFNGRFQSKETTTYAYYCDGLLKKETIQDEYYGASQSIWHSFYTYTEASNCDRKELSDFTIAPNPAHWQATIASDALFSADNTLTIYNVAGAIIQTYKINYRTNKFDFSTLDLINGTYLIRLTNDKNSVTKKFVVLH
jgi:Secretion system C-terminal sorting domain